MGELKWDRILGIFGLIGSLFLYKKWTVKK